MKSKNLLDLSNKLQKFKIIKDIYSALLFGVLGISAGAIINVGANVFYDQVVKGNRIMEIGTLVIVMVIIIILVCLMKIYERKMGMLEQDIKNLQNKH